VLGIAGETTLAVPPLALPDPAHLPPLDVLARYEAVRLFIVRARAVQPGITISAENTTAIAGICHQLDGIPLAIELAAARVRLLRIEQIAARLDDRFRLLTGGSRTALPRHQTLRALIDWSYDLLAEPERHLLQQLSVFVGGWTLEAAEEIADCRSQIADLAMQARARAAESSICNLQSSMFDLLASLVNKSLVVVEHQRAGEARYRLLETIREYALERLAEPGGRPGQAEALRRRHARYYAGLAEAAAPEWASGLATLEDTWPELLAADQENLRAALHWSLVSDAAETGAPLALALSFFWRHAALLSDGRRWIEALLSQIGADTGRRELRARLLLASGVIAVQQGDSVRGRAALEEALAICRGLGDARSSAWVLGQLGYLTYIKGDTSEAGAQYEESLALRQQLGDTRGAAWVLFRLGVIAQDMHPSRATALFEESLALLRQLGDQHLLAQMLLVQGEFLRYGRDPARAQALLAESLALMRRLGDSRRAARALRELGAAMREAGDEGPAVDLLEEALALFRACRDSFGIAETLHNLGETLLLGGDDARAWDVEQESLQLWRELGSPMNMAWPLQNLGRIALRRHDHRTARAYFLEALRLLHERQHRFTVAVCLMDLAGVAILAAPNDQGALRAARLLGAAEALREMFRVDLARIKREELERTLAAARPHLSEAAWAAAWGEGRALSVDEAVGEALAREEQLLVEKAKG
jgi:non-specific serine/threonine protein kinase